MRIFKVEKITDEIVDAFERLIPQLSADLSAPSRTDLEAVVNMEGSNLFLAELDGNIVGTISLVVYIIPTGKKARIEDVIVDSSARGQGVANQLMQVTIDYAKEEGITKLDLTSSPQRQAAHALYEKFGFVKRETNVFRLEL